MRNDAADHFRSSLRPPTERGKHSNPYVPTRGAVAPRSNTALIHGQWVSGLYLCAKHATRGFRLLRFCPDCPPLGESPRRTFLDIAPVKSRSIPAPRSAARRARQKAAKDTRTHRSRERGEAIHGAPAPVREPQRAVLARPRATRQAREAARRTAGALNRRPTCGEPAVRNAEPRELHAE